MNPTIQYLVNLEDIRTSRAYFYSWSKLGLIGDWNSPFLKAVKKKADEFKITCTDNLLDCYALVYDNETANMSPMVKQQLSSTKLDIDSAKNFGMSAVAEAILNVIQHKRSLTGKKITVVGRGHATDGLLPILVRCSATLTLANSFTPDIFEAVDGADIAIYATPKINDMRKPNVNELVIDLNGIWSNDPFAECEYINRIGPLTVAILINRFTQIVN